MTISNKIKKIINAIKDTEINDIEISSFWGFQKIKLSKGNKVPNDSKNYDNLRKSEETVIIDKETNEEIKEIDNVPADNSKNENHKVEDISGDSFTKQTAPLVGTFYAASKPGEPPFIKVGDNVSAGQSVCIIEAMKIFNEIESEYSGEIIEILIEDGQPVEYGQPLFTVKEI